MEIHETDTAGKRVATYIVSRSSGPNAPLTDSSEKGQKEIERVDVVVCLPFSILAYCSSMKHCAVSDEENVLV